MIFGILRQVAVGPCIGDLLNDARPLDLLAVLEFILQHRIARRCHGDHIHSNFWPPILEHDGVLRNGACPRTKTFSRVGPPKALSDRELFPDSNSSGFAAEIALQRANLEVAPEVGLDSLRSRNGP